MDHRPVYLNLVTIRLPLTGIISIAHRVSGLLLFIAIPYLVYLLDLSISSEASFQEVMSLTGQPMMKLFALLLLWSLAHHFFAGIRYLLIDAEIGIDLAGARLGAWLVLAAEILVIVLLTGFLLL